MTVNLELMQARDFKDFYEVSMKEFAEEQVKNGTWDASEADSKGRAYFEKLLPQGL